MTNNFPLSIVGVQQKDQKIKTTTINNQLYYYDVLKDEWLPYIGSLVEKLQDDLDYENNKTNEDEDV